MPMDDQSNDEDTGREQGLFVHSHKDIFRKISPRSPLTTQSPPLSTLSQESGSLDLAIDAVVGNSIDQLYHNVCEMQSSDQSPSRRSYISYGEESRLDSELRFLARGDDGSVVTRDHGENCKASPDEKKTLSPVPTKRSSHIQWGSEGIKKATLRSQTLNGRPPYGKQSVKGVKTLGKVSSLKNEKSPPLVGNKLRNGTDHQGEKGHLGPYLLKQARDLMASGDNLQKALELVLRARRSFEISEDGQPNLEYVMCLHVASSLYCRLGRYSEAIPVLERSIDIPVLDLGPNHALAKFAGCMQLGDTYAMMGQVENSILFYSAGLEIQRQVLGEKDPRFAETCRYLAEAHVQAMQFDEAEKLCQTALSIHQENGSPGSPQEAADRRLLGLICDAKGDYQGALEQYVLACMTMAANGMHDDVAAVDCNIGDVYLSLARYDEAVFAYQKALNMLKSSKGDNHPSVASVFVRLADLYNKIGKFSESKSYCDNALRIYAKPTPGSLPEEIASGLVGVSAIYESINEPERALELLQEAVEKYAIVPGHQMIAAGIEAQMGVLCYILGNYTESYKFLKNATSKFHSVGEKKSTVFGIALNQLGLACVQLLYIKEASVSFEESRSILEAECGPYHADTLGVYSNLAGTYDAMGRTADAIEILEYVVELREEKLGTANSEVEDEKRRLAELLKESGLVRRRKCRSLETLLVKNPHSHRMKPDHLLVS